MPESTRALAAQKLWRALAAACEEGGQNDLITDQMGYIVLEFGVGLLALDFDKPTLMTFLANMLAEIGRNEMEVMWVGVAGLDQQRKQGKKTWSWVQRLSGLADGDPAWGKAQMKLLEKLRVYSPGLG